jgi:lia operon protein LiaG
MPYLESQHRPSGRRITGLLLVALVVGLAALALAANAIVLTLAVSAATLPGRSVDTRALSGDRVGVYNLAGEVHILGGSGRDVSVEVTRGGRDGGELEITTGVLDGASTLRVIYPGDRIVYSGMGRGSSTQLSVRDDGRFNDSNDHNSSFRRHRVTLTGSGSGLEAHADLTLRVPPGRTLALYLGVGAVAVSNVDGDLRVDVAAANVRSEHTRGRLLVDTGSGEVIVHDAGGDVSIDTGSGTVEVDGVRGSRLHVDTGSGNVSASRVDAPTVSIDTGSGSVSLDAVRADDIDVDTGSGAVEVALLSDIHRLHVDTGSGSVTIHAPATLGAMVRVESSRDHIDSDFPLELTHRSDDAIEGRIGDGRGRIDIDTGSGSVRLMRTR